MGTVVMLLIWLAGCGALVWGADMAPVPVVCGYVLGLVAAFASVLVSD